MAKIMSIQVTVEHANLTVIDEDFILFFVTHGDEYPAAAQVANRVVG
jgi:hypothetical protein